MSASSMPTPPDFRKLRIELCWAYADTPVYGSRHTIHSPPWNSAWFIEEGAAIVESGGERRTATRGEFMLPCLATRRQEFAPGTRLRSVGFIARWPAGWPLVDSSTTRVLRGPDAIGLGEGGRRLVEQMDRDGRGDRYGLLRGVDTPARFCALQQAFFGWMTLLLDVLERNGCALRMAPPAPEVEVVLAALEQWPIDRPFELKVLAAGLGLGPRRVQQLMRKHLKATPGDYLVRRRLEVAVHELRVGLLSMKEIAGRVGFRFESNFSLWFRRLRGQSPSAFRRKGLTF